jgi:hypothetical protein
MEEGNDNDAKRKDDNVMEGSVSKQQSDDDDDHGNNKITEAKNADEEENIESLQKGDMSGSGNKSVPVTVETKPSPATPESEIVEVAAEAARSEETTTTKMAEGPGPPEESSENSQGHSTAIASDGPNKKCSADPSTTFAAAGSTLDTDANNASTAPEVEQGRLEGDNDAAALEEKTHIQVASNSAEAEVDAAPTATSSTLSVRRPQGKSTISLPIDQTEAAAADDNILVVGNIKDGQNVIMRAAVSEGLRALRQQDQVEGAANIYASDSADMHSPQSQPDASMISSTAPQNAAMSTSIAAQHEVITTSTVAKNAVMSSNVAAHNAATVAASHSKSHSDNNASGDEHEQDNIHSDNEDDDDNVDNEDDNHDDDQYEGTTALQLEEEKRTLMQRLEQMSRFGDQVLEMTPSTDNAHAFSASAVQPSSRSASTPDSGTTPPSTSTTTATAAAFSRTTSAPPLSHHHGAAVAGSGGGVTRGGRGPKMPHLHQPKPKSSLSENADATITQPFTAAPAPIVAMPIHPGALLFDPPPVPPGPSGYNASASMDTTVHVLPVTLAVGSNHSALHQHSDISTPQSYVTTPIPISYSSQNIIPGLPTSAAVSSTCARNRSNSRSTSPPSAGLLGQPPPGSAQQPVPPGYGGTPHTNPYQLFYHPYLLHTETSLTEARGRLHTALEQTRHLREVFTRRLWEKYHVLLEPVEEPTIAPIVKRCKSRSDSTPATRCRRAVQKRQNMRSWEKRLEGIIMPPLIPMAVGTSSALPSGAGGGSGGFPLVVLPEHDAYPQLVSKARALLGEKKISGASQAAAQLLMERARANDLARRHLCRDLATMLKSVAGVQTSGTSADAGNNIPLQLTDQQKYDLQEMVHEKYGRSGPLAIRIAQEDLLKAKQGLLPLKSECAIVTKGKKLLSDMPRGGAVQLQPNTHVGAMGLEVLTGINVTVMLVQGETGPVSAVVPPAPVAPKPKKQSTKQSASFSSSTTLVVPPIVAANAGAVAAMPPPMMPFAPLPSPTGRSGIRPGSGGASSAASGSTSSISQKIPVESGSLGGKNLAKTKIKILSRPSSTTSPKPSPQPSPGSLKSAAATAAAAAAASISSPMFSSPTASSSRSTLPQRTSYGMDLSLDEAMIIFHRSTGQYRSRMRHRGVPPLATAWSLNFSVDSALGRTTATRAVTPHSNKEGTTGIPPFTSVANNEKSKGFITARMGLRDAFCQKRLVNKWRKLFGLKLQRQVMTNGATLETALQHLSSGLSLPSLPVLTNGGGSGGGRASHASVSTDLPAPWQWMESAHCLAIAGRNQDSNVRSAKASMAQVLDLFYDYDKPSEEQDPELEKDVTKVPVIALPTVAKRRRSSETSALLDTIQEQPSKEEAATPATATAKGKDPARNAEGTPPDSSKADVDRSFESGVRDSEAAPKPAVANQAPSQGGGGKLLIARQDATLVDATLADDRSHYERQDGTLKDDAASSSLASSVDLSTSQKRKASLLLERRGVALTEERKLLQDATLTEEFSSVDEKHSSLQQQARKKAKLMDTHGPTEAIAGKATSRSQTVAATLKLSPRSVSGVTLACALKRGEVKADKKKAGMEPSTVFSVFVALGLLTRESGSEKASSTEKDTAGERPKEEKGPLESKIKLQSNARPAPKFKEGQKVEALWQSPHEAHFSAFSSTATTPYGSDVEGGDKSRLTRVPEQVIAVGARTGSIVESSAAAEKAPVGGLKPSALALATPPSLQVANIAAGTAVSTVPAEANPVSSFMATSPVYHPRSSKNKPFGAQGRGHWYPASVTKIVHKPHLVEGLSREGGACFRYDVAYDDGDVDEGLKVHQLRPRSSFHDHQQHESASYEKDTAGKSRIKSKKIKEFDASRWSQLVVSEYRRDDGQRAAECQLAILTRAKTVTPTSGLVVEPRQQVVLAPPARNPSVGGVPQIGKAKNSSADKPDSAHVGAQKPLHEIATRDSKQNAGNEFAREKIPTQENTNSSPRMSSKKRQLSEALTAPPADDYKRARTTEHRMAMRPESSPAMGRGTQRSSCGVMAAAEHNLRQRALAMAGPHEPLMEDALSQFVGRDADYESFAQRSRIEALLMERQSLQMASISATMGGLGGASQASAGDPRGGMLPQTARGASAAGYYDLLRPQSTSATTVAYLDPTGGHYSQLSWQASQSAAASSLLEQEHCQAALFATQQQLYGINDAALLSSYENLTSFPPYGRAGGDATYADYMRSSQLASGQSQRRGLYGSAVNPYYGAPDFAPFGGVGSFSASSLDPVSSAIRVATFDSANSQAQSARVAAMMGLAGSNSQGTSLQLMQLQQQAHQQQHAQANAQAQLQAQAQAILNAGQTSWASSALLSSRPQSLIPQSRSRSDMDITTERLFASQQLRIEASAATSAALAAMARPASAAPRANSPKSTTATGGATLTAGAEEKSIPSSSSTTKSDEEDSDLMDAKKMMDISPTTGLRRSLSAPPAQDTGRAEIQLPFATSTHILNQAVSCTMVSAAAANAETEAVSASDAPTSSSSEDQGGKREEPKSSASKAGTTKETDAGSTKDAVATGKGAKPAVLSCIIPVPPKDSLLASGDYRDLAKHIVKGQFPSKLSSWLKPSKLDLWLRDVGDGGDNQTKSTAKTERGSDENCREALEKLAKDTLAYLISVAESIPIERLIIGAEATKIGRMLTVEGVSLDRILDPKIKRVRF